MKRTHLFKALMGLVFLTFLAPLAAGERHPSAAFWTLEAEQKDRKEREHKEREEKHNADEKEREAKKHDAEPYEHRDIRPTSLLQICLNKLADLVTIKTFGITGSSLDEIVAEFDGIAQKLPALVGNQLVSTMQYPSLWHSRELVWDKDILPRMSFITFSRFEPYIIGEAEPVDIPPAPPLPQADHIGAAPAALAAAPTEPVLDLTHAWNIATGEYTYKHIRGTSRYKGYKAYTDSPDNTYYATLEANNTITVRDTSLNKTLVTIPAPAHNYYGSSYNNLYLMFIDDNHIRIMDPTQHHITVYRINYKTKSAEIIHTRNAQDIYILYKKHGNEVYDVAHTWVQNGNAYIVNYATWKISLVEKDVSRLYSDGSNGHGINRITITKPTGETIIFNVQDGMIGERTSISSYDPQALSFLFTSSNNGRYGILVKRIRGSLDPMSQWYQWSRSYEITIFDFTLGHKVITFSVEVPYFLTDIIAAISDDGTQLALVCSEHGQDAQHLSLLRAIPRIPEPLDHAYLCEAAFNNSTSQEDLLSLLSSKTLSELTSQKRDPIVDKIVPLLRDMDDEQDADVGEEENELTYQEFLEV